MVMLIPTQYAPSCYSCLLVAILMATLCHSWNSRSRRCRHNNNHNHNLYPIRHRNRNSALLLSQASHSHDHRQRHLHKETEPTKTTTTKITGITRRHLFFESMTVAPVLFITTMGLPNAAIASSLSRKGVVTVQLEFPGDSLGVEIYDTMLRGKNIVAIRRIVVANKNNRFLMEGMILRPQNGDSYTAKELSERLRTGPYPLEVDFVNLGAGGDAISDAGNSIVSARDALELAKKTEDSNTSTGNPEQQKGGGYSMTMLQQTPQTCAIRSRRNDVLEIEYEASYILDGKKVVYDASAFRGTGNRPYQMVLGSGDMIPGVDQGLYDMCPGDKRLLSIPPVLGHGPKSRRLYVIPDNYQNLEWEVTLVTIDSTITKDNNEMSRDDREGRFAYE